MRLKVIMKKNIINMTYRCRDLRDILTRNERKRYENRQIDWDFVHIVAERDDNGTLFSRAI